MIPLHVLRTGQPQEPTPLELTNPLTQGLVSLPLFSCDGYDAARDFVPTVDDGVTRTASEYGRALRGTTGAEGFNLTAGTGLSSILPVASGYTIMVLMQVVTLGSRRFFLGDFGSALTLESIGMEQTATNTWRLYHVDSGVRASTGGGVSLGWHWVELTWDKATVRGYVDGTALPTSGATANKRAGVDLRALRAGAGTTLGFDGDMAFLGIWDRVLSLDERVRVQDNPWQLYRPVQRRIWAPVAAGGNSQSIAFTLDDVTAAFSQTLSRDQSLSGTLDGVTVSISQTAQHDQALSATLDDVTVAISQTLGNATNQTLAIVLDDVTAAVSQTLSHSQALAATLDGVTVDVSQALSHDQALAATLDGITVEIAQSAAPSIKDQVLAITLDDVIVSIAQSGALPAVGGMGFTLVDMPSSMWWKRKPKAITEEVAKKKIKRVVRAIEQAAQVAQPAAQQREVYQAIAPLLAEMPGFDWKQVFRLIVAQDTARRQMEATIARAKFIEQDEEEVLMLLLSH